MDEMPVLVHDGVVGRVVEVWGDGCKVRLLTDPRFSVAVLVAQDRVTGIASGRAGSDTMALELDRVPRGTGIEDGDMVVTSGFEGSSFPAGLQIGEVRAVEERLGGLPPRARIEPFVDFDRLEYVSVLLWSPGQPPVTSTTTSSTTSTTAPATTETDGTSESSD
jgi:rod shape-determining protein MreC